MQDPIHTPQPPKKTFGGLLETGVEKFIFASRWLLSPFYMGMVAVILVLFVKFAQELVHIVKIVFTASESEVIVGVLSLIDLTFTASLVVIVIFSGYENFVSKIDNVDHKSWPDWMSKIDFAGLKMKLISSIVAISGIQLLKVFMNVKSISDRELMWSTIIHITFVVTGVMLALMDKLSDHKSNDDH
jgi:uncharacterized protein (TIGR00645 family)